MAMPSGRVKAWLGRVFQSLPDGIAKRALRHAFLRLTGRVPLSLLVSKGDTLVSVGEPYPDNVDTYAYSVGSEGRVILVEPEEQNVKNLRAHIESRSYANVTVVPKGAWNAKGQQTLLLSEGVSAHRLKVEDITHYNDLGGYEGSTVIEVDTIDNLMKELDVGSVDFMTITVNGMELQVLEGGERTLPRTRWLFVVGRGRRTDTGVSINGEIAAFLRERGFITYITPPRQKLQGWGIVDGDVYAWRRD